MEINQKTLDKIQLVELVGRIDAINNAKTEDFFSMITENQQSHIVVDCEKLDYINSSGLRVFIMSLKKAKKANKELIICNLQKNIKEVFQYSGFDKLFNIHLNREEAIKNLNGSFLNVD